MSRYFSLFILALSLVALTTPSWATHIYVSGDQTGTWAADTVIVFAEVRVPPRQSLTILPGVEVLFSVYCKLIVDTNATLRAVGTPADSIHFDVLPPNGNWDGLHFQSALNTCQLRYCKVRYGAAGEPDYMGGGIYCSNSTLTLSNNTLEANSAMNDGAGIYCTGSICSIIGNVIANNICSGSGAGIYGQNNSSLTISGNIILGNSMQSASGTGVGGGLCCLNSNATISANLIENNNAKTYGGGLYCGGNNSHIVDNIILANSVNSSETYIGGGGIYCSGSGVLITGNVIAQNTVTSNLQLASPKGGGIYLAATGASLTNNAILGNHAFAGPQYEYGSGGGVYTNSTSLVFQGNLIKGNAAGNGGGVYNSAAGLVLRNNTFTGNSVYYFYGVGAVYSQGSGVQVDNCIFWGNSMDPVGPMNNITVSYSCIDITGVGNFFSDPMFVNSSQSDYRLQWGSPCIDTGDPNPIYNDPDNTRADMGAWYYDQSIPMRVLLTPYNAPIQIPASGGSFQYNIQVTNTGSTTLPTLGWCNVTLPSGAIYGPVLGPLNVSVGSGQTVSRLRTQVVPASAPAGLYHYNAFAVAAGDTSEDSFTFVKLGFGIQGSGFGGWVNTGEEFDVGARHAVPLSGSGPEGGLRSATPTTAISPDPFNATTVARFELRVASHVSLKVYDIAGRLVATLVDGWREAGEHRVTFEGSGLSAGVYLYRLQAGAVIASGKMVLLK